MDNYAKTYGPSLAEIASVADDAGLEWLSTVANAVGELLPIVDERKALSVTDAVAVIGSVELLESYRLSRDIGDPVRVALEDRMECYTDLMVDVVDDLRRGIENFEAHEQAEDAPARKGGE